LRGDGTFFFGGRRRFFFGVVGFFGSCGCSGTFFGGNLLGEAFFFVKFFL